GRGLTDATFLVGDGDDPGQLERRVTDSVRGAGVGRGIGQRGGTGEIGPFGLRRGGGTGVGVRGARVGTEIGPWGLGRGGGGGTGVGVRGARGLGRRHDRGGRR